MHDLKSLTPLGAAAPRVDRIGAVSIAEVTDMALASLSARSGKVEALGTAMTALTGAKLPEPGTWVDGAPWSVIWTGPEQWFVEAPFASHEDISRALKDAVGEAASVTEQTDGWVRFDLEGAGTVDMLERLCAAPSRRMEAGMATRTVIEHMGCLVICRAAAERFSILAPRSYARSLHYGLTGAARSIA